MRYQTGLGKERLISRFLALVLLIFLGATAKGVERIYYHINDPSGSPVMVVDAEGAVVARYVYTPFGSQMAAQPAARQRLGFVGSIRETPGLHYLKHRYYNPQLGRFYQPDPVDFLQRGVPQINRYAYGRNDPYTYQDKDGRCPACVALIPLGIWLLDNFHSDTPSPNPTPPSGMGDAAVMGYGIAGIAVKATMVKVAEGAGSAAFSGTDRVAANAEIAVPKAGSPFAGGGAKLENLTASEILRIQNAANRSGQEIVLVGSRAGGTARSMSDWDYVINANSKIRNSLSKSLPGAGSIREGISPNIDIFKGVVDESKPFIRFFPE